MARGGSWHRGRWMLLLLIAVCVAPVLASYFTYYVIRPRGGSTNYGALVEPQRPIPSDLAVRNEKGEVVLLSSLTGKWLLIAVDGSDCNSACATKLYLMRQLRLTQGPERERVTTVWLRTDAGAIPAQVEGAYASNTRILIADPAALARWLPVPPGETLPEHIFLVDPLGHLMMRFPKHPDANRVKGDLTKLLKWSGSG